MRVGILTFHEIHNPGAFWQAYATVQLVKSIGHEAVIINYNNPAHRFRMLHKLFHPMTIRHPRSTLETAGKVSVYRKVQRALPLTPRLETYTEVENEHFDAIVIGSDIVWDFKTKRLGNDPVYFGKYLNTDNLIAYAPSCGSCSSDENIPEYVSEGLPKFKAVSVRDANTQAMVQRVLGKNVLIIGDPTFNLDFHGLEKMPSQTNPCLVVYAMNEFVSEGFKSAVIRFARERKLEIIAIGYRNSWADRNVVFADPFKWLGWLMRADYVATNTFHGTLFSMYLEKQFVTELNPAISKKTALLLSELGLESRIFKVGISLAKMMDSYWLKDQVTSRIKGKADSARNFLVQALGEV